MKRFANRTTCVRDSAYGSGGHLRSHEKAPGVTHCLCVEISANVPVPLRVSNIRRKPGLHLPLCQLAGVGTFGSKKIAREQPMPIAPNASVLSAKSINPFSPRRTKR